MVGNTDARLYAKGKIEVILSLGCSHISGSDSGLE